MMTNHANPRRLVPCAVILSALLASACSPAPAKQAEVVVSDAWCRPSPNGAQAGACYATLTASGDDRLTGGSTTNAAELQIHEMKTEDGMMRMAQLKDGLPLAAGQDTLLAPGGNHLMLIGLTRPLVEGQSVSLTLDFASAPSVTAQAAVRKPPASGMNHSGH